MLPCGAMGTDAALRKHILRVTTKGVNQKALAASMGVSETWLSRWLRGEKGLRPITVEAMDGFHRYVAELQDVLKETQRATDVATAEGGFLTDTDPKPKQPERPRTKKRSA